METTKDSSARYFPLSQTIRAEYVFLFAMSRTIADSLGRYYLLSRTIRDEYVFNSIMSNRLSDRYPGRAQKHTPLARLSSTISPFAGRLVERMQYAPTLLEKDEVSSGRYFLLSRTKVDKYVFLFSMSNRLSDRYPGRAQKHTPLIDSTSTLSPFAGRLVGRMQYVPTFPEKDKVSLGMRFPLSRTMADQYVFHFSMSNRLSDRYPGRAQKHTPLTRLSSTLSPLAGRLVGRMQYAPTLPTEKSDLKGWREVMSETRGDEYVFHSTMSNRFSNRHPGRAQKYTPLARLSSTLSPFAGRLVRRMQYAPTLPAEKSDLKDLWEVTFGTIVDKYVFLLFMSNWLSDRYPGRGVLHTPLNHSRKGYLIARQTIVGRMQYAPTLPEKDEVSLGRYFPSSRTMVDKYVFHFFMSNWLSDRYPCRGVLHTPLARLSSTLSHLMGRLVGRMQYASTLSKKDEGSSGRYFLLSQTMADESVFHSSMSNQLLNRYPGRTQKNTPLVRLSSTLSPLAGRLVERMQYAPTLSEKDKVFSGWYFPLSRTMADKYVFHFFMSNRLSDRYPCRGVLHMPLARLSSTPTPLAGRLVGRIQYAPTLPAKKSNLKGW